MTSRTAAHKGTRKSKDQGVQNDRKVVEHAFYADAVNIALNFLLELSVEAMASGSTIARDVYNAVRNRDYATLVNFTVDPASYSDAGSFQRDYQLVSLLRKSAFLETGIDRKGQAIKKWCAAERQCANTNDYIRGQLYGGSPDPTFLAILQRMRDFIGRTLGPAPKLRDLDCRFGPGSTQMVKRGITLPKKYSKRICCTPELIDHVHDVIGFHWNPNELYVVDGNSLSFVPKDAKTDRSICVEPDLNIFVQLGVGKALRKQFRRYFDLDNQADVNRAFVRDAIPRLLATIDLSSASDMVASELVYAVFPEDWVELFDLCRCRYTTIEGTKYENQKFSSMGNGFTFELETIIFYAACRAVGVDPDSLSVFGDDIIVPQADALSVIQALNKLGFIVNQEKTFLSGPFYESCGHDYFNGKFVRPFFWKSCGQPVDVIKMCNDVSRMAKNDAYPWHGRSTHVYRKTHEAFVKLLRIHGWYAETPEGYGDIGVITDLDSATPKCDSSGYLTCKAVRWVSKDLDYSRRTNGYVAALHRGGGETIVLSAKGSRPKLHAVRGAGKWMLTPFHVPSWDWSGFGPWLD